MSPSVDNENVLHIHYLLCAQVLTVCLSVTYARRLPWQTSEMLLMLGIRCISYPDIMQEAAPAAARELAGSSSTAAVSGSTLAGSPLPHARDPGRPAGPASSAVDVAGGTAAQSGSTGDTEAAAAKPGSPEPKEVCAEGPAEERARALSASGLGTPAACRVQEAARADASSGLEPRVAVEGAGSGSPRRARAAPRWVQVAPEVMEEPGLTAEPDLAAPLGARAPGQVPAPEPVLAKAAAARQGVPSAGMLVCVDTVGAAPDLAPLPDLAPVPEAAPVQAAPLAALRRGLCSAALKQGAGSELGPGSPACVPPATPRLLPSGWARLSRTLSPSPSPSPSSSAGKHLATDGVFSPGAGSQGAVRTAAGGTEQGAPDARSGDSEVITTSAAAGLQEAPHAGPAETAQGSPTGAHGGPSSRGSAGGGGPGGAPAGEGGAAGARSGALGTAPDACAPERAAGEEAGEGGPEGGTGRSGDGQAGGSAEGQAAPSDESGPAVLELPDGNKVGAASI